MPFGGVWKPLIDEVELRISVENQPFCPFDKSLWSKGHSFQLKVKCVKKASREGLPEVKVKVYNLKEYQSTHQGEYGRLFKEGDYGVFSARSPDPSPLLFLLEVFCRDSEGTTSPFGFCYLPGDGFGEPKEIFAVIVDKCGIPVGKLTVQTHCILPWANAKLYKDLTAQEWKATKKTQICGHRGMGRNKPDKALLLEREAQGSTTFPENTVAAFKEAHRQSVPMVEFDVHVTRDHFPVIFHDFDTDLGIEEKESGKLLDFATVHISGLTLKQTEVFRNLQPSHQGPDFECSLVALKQSHLDCRPLPTVQEALESVNEELAFHIEVKYPMTDVGGKKESDGGDRNVLVDSLLDVVFRHAGNRSIIFSSFDPDVCIMLRQKQGRYPVLLANFGQTEKYASYRGLRCSSAEIAVYLSLAENLQGLNGHSDDYVAEPSLISTLHDNGRILCVWGEENNEVVYINKLKDLGVDLIITDRVELANSL